MNITGLFSKHYIKQHNKTIRSLKHKLESSKKRVEKYYSEQKQSKFGNLPKIKQNIITLQKIKNQNEKQMEVNKDDYDYDCKQDNKMLTKMFRDSKL